MSDLVKRLRSHSGDYGMYWLEDVADRIEELEAQLAALLEPSPVEPYEVAEDEPDEALEWRDFDPDC